MVENTGLAWGDGALRDVQRDVRLMVGEWGNGGGGAGMIVADLGGHFDGGFERIERDPIAPIDDELGFIEIGIFADDDAVGCWIELKHVDGLWRRDPEAFSLAYGVEFDPVVMTENDAVAGDDFASMSSHEIGSFEEASVIAIWNEANLHTLLFVGGAQLAFACEVAGVGFGHFTEREKSTSELLLAQGEEEVTLILARVASFAEQRAARSRTFNACEVARCDEICSELIRARDEGAELEFLIAHHARIGSASGFVFIGEVLDDLLLELLGFVDEIIRDAEFVANGARIHDGLGAAAFVFGPRHTVLGPQFESDTYDVVALFEQ